MELSFKLEEVCRDFVEIHSLDESGRVSVVVNACATLISAHITISDSGNCTAFEKLIQDVEYAIKLRIDAAIKNHESNFHSTPPNGEICH